MIDTGAHMAVSIGEKSSLSPDLLLILGLSTSLPQKTVMPPFCPNIVFGFVWPCWSCSSTMDPPPPRLPIGTWSLCTLAISLSRLGVRCGPDELPHKGRTPFQLRGFITELQLIPLVKRWRLFWSRGRNIRSHLALVTGEQLLNLWAGNVNLLKGTGIWGNANEYACGGGGTLKSYSCHCSYIYHQHMLIRVIFLLKQLNFT